jgi:hypothetical protein
MYGGIAFRELAVAPLQRLSAKSPPEWVQRGTTERGEQIWDRKVSPDTPRPAFHVTVLYSPDSGESRSLYCTSIVDDEVPRIPSQMRWETAVFIEELRRSAGEG